MLRVDFRVRKGAFLLQPSFEAQDELVVLIGASGSGKSLTLQAIAGLLTPASGEIVLPDDTVAFRSSEGIDIPPQERGVGYVVQDLALFPHLTVRQNIEFALGSLPRGAAGRRSAELIALLGLEGTEDRRPRDVSGGQQQRVALARALAREPRLLLLDEPFSGLESALRSSLRRELLSIRRRLKLTALFVTHDIDEAYTLADRIVVYDDGRVVQSGARDDVFYRPATLEAAKLVGVRNFVPGDVIAVKGGVGEVRTSWFTATIPAPEASLGDPVWVCIRPEHILLARTQVAPHNPNDTILDARVIEDTAHPLQHSLIMTVRAVSESSPPLSLEVDVPTHPYELLDLSSTPCRRVVLPFGRVFIVKRT